MTPIKKASLEAVRDLIKKGYVFYTPTGTMLRTFRDVFISWPIYGEIYARKRNSEKIWILRSDGNITELV